MRHENVDLKVLPNGKAETPTDEADDSINLKGITCPHNFVRIKLALEKMRDGQNLEVLVDDGPPMHNVPRSIKEEGHRIIRAERLADNGFRLLIRKGGGGRNGR